ncbi:hypothetical protein E2C01_030876 [Portunus trituberculatus]|uniref:Uncharacterized protein n=1 Tax=Portunus trituberculatus TaxID=210409 RepID=A0A5B7ES71_PORTR|nr:hypothetical protein [Portunus trituberculatus]
MQGHAEASIPGNAWSVIRHRESKSSAYFKFRESKRDRRARATTKPQLSKQTLARQIYHGSPEQVGHAANTGNLQHT